MFGFEGFDFIYKRVFGFGDFWTLSQRFLIFWIYGFWCFELQILGVLDLWMFGAALLVDVRANYPFV